MRTVRAKKVKKYSKNVKSWIIDGPLSDQSDREHDNPLKPDRTSTDVGKKLGQSDRRRILTKFPHPKEVDFLRILWFRRICIKFYTI